MLSGSALRGITIYDEPFWRNDGLSGMSVAPDLPVPVALDQSPRSGNPGILSSYMLGPQAVRAAALDPAERRDIWFSPTTPLIRALVGNNMTLTRRVSQLLRTSCALANGTPC